jgi:hydroxymethylpyrimidine pyrophosphatase-like HAD family hydrolase
MLRKGGATVKLSSIHINAWIGSFSKLEMSRILLADEFGIADAAMPGQIYVGDSPNDEPMFEYFDNAVGVANIQEFMGLISHPPRWVTAKPGGFGFAEQVDLIHA